MPQPRHAVVIGGGITGILTARELLLNGWTVDVLEAGHIGSGSSSRTAAGIRQQFSTEATVRGMRYSVAFYRQFSHETSDGRSPLVEQGYLFLYDSVDALNAAHDRVTIQRRAGLEDVEVLNAQELALRFPWVDSDTVVGGTFCPSDGFLLPELVYQEGARRVEQLGGKIHQRAEVESATVVDGKLVAVQTTKGEFAADLFVDATNAWTNRLAGRLGAERLPVEPVKRHLWFLDRDGPMTGETMAGMPLVISPSGVYCRPENADTLMMGWGRPTPAEEEFTREDQDAIFPGFAPGDDLDAVPYEAWANLAEAVPEIGEFAGIRATTAGYYANTPDHNPFLCYDRQIPNLIRLVGFSGHGAMFGPFSAKVAAELAEAGEDLVSIDLEGVPVSLSAFARIRDLAAESLVI